MILHRIEPADQADQLLSRSNAPLTAEAPTGDQVSAEFTGVYAVRYDSQSRFPEADTSEMAFAGLGVDHDTIRQE